MPSGSKPMKGESAKNFAYFVSYRDQPDATRSIVEVARMQHRDRSRIGLLCAKFKWVARVKDYAIEQQELRKQAEMEAIKSEAIELERRRKQMREDAWLVYGELLTTARSHLRLLDKEKRPIRGKPVDAARLAQVAEIMGRLGADMPLVTRAEITGKGGMPLAPILPPYIKIDYLSDIESRKLMEQSQAGKRKENDK